MASESRNKIIKSKSRDPVKIRRFLEELSWLLNTYSDIDFKAIEKIAYQDLFNKKNITSIESYTPENPNIQFMVGVLPIILDDRKIFPSNEDIASFSKEVLKLEVPYWQKRSKYEIIGNIICNTYKLNDKGLSKLVRVLSKLVQNDQKAKKLLRDKRKKTVSWNEIIDELSSLK